ncbi:MAG: YoaK family protein [Enterococcus sp.]
MQKTFHEKRTVGLLLTFIGGIMDSYTYIHYNAFSSAQTGNIVLAIIEAGDGQWQNVGKKLLSTLFFLFGIIIAKYLTNYFKAKKITYWRLFILYFEALAFFLVGLPSINQHPLIVTTTISFSAAIMWVIFDKINGLAYTNLFTTGNLKGMATSFYDCFISKNKAALAEFYHFFSVVIAFILGIIAAVWCFHTIGDQTIFLASLVFLYLALRETYLVWRYYQIPINVHQK